MNKPWGRFYGIGVGPGDPELMTLKAIQILHRVPVICYPQAVAGDRSMALAIVDRAIPLEGKVLVAFPFTMSSANSGVSWQKALNKVLTYLQEGKDCAFITEGDPFTYSTFIYVYEYMRHHYPHVPVEVVPGVSSVMASAARAGVPLAVGKERVALLPALYHVTEISHLLDHWDTIVLLKVNRVLADLAPELARKGLVEKAVLVRRATLPEEQISWGHEALRNETADYFSLLIVRR